MLIHLRDQLLALERIANLMHRRPLISAEEYDPLASLLPFPVSRYLRRPRQRGRLLAAVAAGTWRRMMWTAGFDRVEQKGTFGMKVKDEFTVPHVVIHGFKG